MSRLKALVFLASISGLSAVAQINGGGGSGIALRIITGAGTPSTGCTKAADVGKVYLQNNVTGSTSPIYACSKVGASSFSWVNSGTSSGGSGTVTSITIQGTANQVSVSSCAITVSGTCTVSLPSVLTLPGTVNKLTLTAPATAATLTIADGKTLTDTSGVGAVPLLGATGGGFAAAAASNIYGLWSGCSADKVLFGTGVCGVPNMASTVAVYVSAAGSDSNSGASWATAKLTVAAAVTALPLSSGGVASHTGTVFVGPGTFTESATPIEYNANIQIFCGTNGDNAEGVTNATVIKLANSKNTALFAYTSAYATANGFGHYLQITNCTLDGNAANNSTAPSLVQIYNGGYQNTFRNVSFQNFNSYALLLENAAVDFSCYTCTFGGSNGTSGAVFVDDKVGGNVISFYDTQLDNTGVTAFQITQANTDTGGNNILTLVNTKTEGTTGAANHTHVIDFKPRTSAGGHPFAINILGMTVQNTQGNGTSAIFQETGSGVGANFQLSGINAGGYTSVFNNAKTGRTSAAGEVNLLVDSDNANTADIVPNLAMSGALSTAIPNDAGGTTQFLLAKINSSGNAVKIGTGDTAIPVFPVIDGAGTTGSSDLAMSGLALCQVDGSGATIAHFIVASTATAGRCADAGATAPTSGWVLGIALSTAAANANTTVLLAPGYNAASGGGSGYSTIDSNGSAITQRSTVNFIQGTNMTVSCVDNAGATRSDCTFTSSATASTAFSALTGSTNTTAAMVVGSGATLGTSGTGTITATAMPLSGLTASAASTTIANGDNPFLWNSATTTAGRIALKIGETTASTSTGTPYNLQVITLIGSTATPLNATNSLNGSQTLPTLSITPTWNTSGVVDAALLVNVTNTASGTASKLIDLQIGGTSQFSIDKAGNGIMLGSLSTGATPPSASVCAAGTGGMWCGGEGTAATGTFSAADGFWADSTQHGLMANFNGGGALPLVQGPASSASNHVPTFNSSTGGLLKDSGLTLTASTGTITITNGKTLSVSNTLTLAGTDGTTMTFPATSATIARTDALQTFTGVQTFSTAIAVGSGGTGAGTFTAHGPLVGETTSAIVATSPGTTGQCYLSNGASSDPSFQACPGGAGAGNSVTSTTPVLVNTNTTSDQQLMELSLGAGYFNSSKQPFLFDGAGVYSTQTAQTPTITLKIKLCTVSGCGSGTVVTLISIVSTATIAAVTNNNWNLSILGYTATTGATGNLEIHGPLALDLGALTTTADSIFVDTNTAVSSNIDLTAALFVDFTIAFSTNAVTANTFTQRSGGVMPFGATAAPVTSVFTQTGAVGNLTGDCTTTNTTAVTCKPGTSAPGTSVTLSGSSQIFVCTSTCTITVPVPSLNLQYCVMNDDNVATVITLSAIGSSARYENTARTAYGTAGTGTFISGGAVGDMVCISGRDSTHYLTASFRGTWTAN